MVGAGGSRISLPASGPGARSASIMHEMSITQALLDLVLETAGEQRVTGIYLRVGAMSSIVPDSVAIFFDFLSKRTVAEGAQLHFERVPATLTCDACGAQIEIALDANESPQLAVAEALARGCSCGGKRLRITHGLGFDLVSLDVLTE